MQSSRRNRKITGKLLAVPMGKEKGPDSVVGRQGKVLEKVMKSRGVIRWNQ